MMQRFHVPDWERALKAVGVLFGGLAWLIAMVIVFGALGAKDNTIGSLKGQVSEQSDQIGRLERQVDQLTSNVESGKATTDCRSLLALEVSLRTADQSKALGDLITVALAGSSPTAAVKAFQTANDELATAIEARRNFEQNPEQDCPITSAALDDRPHPTPATPPAGSRQPAGASSSADSTNTTSTTTPGSPPTTYFTPTTTRPTPLCDLLPVTIPREIPCL